MAIIIRIDVDRPYGKNNIFKQLLSRISSDFYLPRIKSFGYLKDLKTILNLLYEHKKRAYIFFRKCTLPSIDMIKYINEGKHQIGMHLENSRNFSTFQTELNYFTNYFNQEIIVFSKHGSGIYKYGFNHYPYYEPKKYIIWADKTGVKLFFGNEEDPSQIDYFEKNVHIFPSAFWLEPSWRRTDVFTIDWLIRESKKRDIVLLIHPDNVTFDKQLLGEFDFILSKVSVKVLS